MNITAVFKEIDHTLITAEKMREIFELSEKEKKNSPFLEPSPNVKILVIPGRQKEIIIEEKRLRVNDKSGKEPNKSELEKYFQIAFDSLVDKTKLIAYGFNYDILVKSEKKIDFKKLSGKCIFESLESGSNILESGVRVLFEKEEKRYFLQTSPTEDPYKMRLHLNTHYSLKEINLRRLKEQLNENYLKLIGIIKRI
ncbi:MAG: hypothetical protein KKC53_01535 [Actinobacteria bacterium]|nr:hypothetical protein [Actinomycetota bacterium]